MLNWSTNHSEKQDAQETLLHQRDWSDRLYLLNSFSYPSTKYDNSIRVSMDKNVDNVKDIYSIISSCQPL